MVGSRRHRSPSPPQTAVFFALLAMLCACPDTRAHDSLYNYVELRLIPSGEVEIQFSVHAAEFTQKPGVDPAATDTSWYQTLSDRERGQLLEDARGFLETTYQLANPDHSGARPFAVPAFDQTSSIDTGPRPGCLVATLVLDSVPKSLSLSYAATGKRLMVVVTRAGAFPKVHDIEPGATCTLRFDSP